MKDHPRRVRSHCLEKKPMFFQEHGPSSRTARSSEPSPTSESTRPKDYVRKRRSAVSYSINHSDCTEWDAFCRDNALSSPLCPDGTVASIVTRAESGFWDCRTSWHPPFNLEDIRLLNELSQTGLVSKGRSLPMWNIEWIVERCEDGFVEARASNTNCANTPTMLAYVNGGVAVIFCNLNEGFSRAYTNELRSNARMVSAMVQNIHNDNALSETRRAKKSRR